MKILKKNQLVALVISLMLVTAGYLNFSPVADKENKSEFDATLVNSNPSQVEETSVPNEVEETNTNLSSQEEEKDYYFENSKLDRDKMYSQMLETYQEIYEGEDTPEAQKEMAISEIANINSIRNAIMICENLIKTKGFKDLVIFVNDGQISVVVDAQNLSTEQIAQIQNIISRELPAAIENIHISCK